jgi:trk system potassium uptake protein TrkH
VADVVAGRHAVVIFGRRIGEDRLRLATASLCYYLGLATVATFALAITEAGAPLGAIAFEVISCLSTVGLSQGLTAEVSAAGHVILILLMFAGRVGLITFAIAIALPPGHEPYEEGHDLVL